MLNNYAQKMETLWS